MWGPSEHMLHPQEATPACTLEFGYVCVSVAFVRGASACAWTQWTFALGTAFICTCLYKREYDVSAHLLM